MTSPAPPTSPTSASAAPPTASRASGEGPQFTLGRSLLFSTIIVCTLLGLVEIGLRLAGVKREVRPQILLRRIDVDITFPFMRPDRDLLWSLKPGFSGIFLGNRVSINSLGLRGPEVELPKPAGRTRIVCFGDSVTFGYGVADDESYPAVLAAALRARGVDADVIDAGVTGYTSHQVRGLVTRVLPRLEADVVTVAIGWNDASRRPVHDREYERRLRQAMSFDSVLDHSALYSFLKRVYVRWRIKTLPDRNDTPRVPLEHYAENLTAIVTAVRATGARPAFVELPRRRDGRPNAPDVWTYPDAFEASAGRLGLPVLSAGVLGRRDGDERTERYFVDKLHLSVEGSRLLGQTLATQLLERGLVAARAAR